MEAFELTKLVSLYKAYCSGKLSVDVVKEEIADSIISLDREYYKTGTESENIKEYIEELNILLFDVMKHDQTNEISLLLKNN